ncbi:MAG TPA: protoporphyrinogen oxidase [Lacipirellulaceae bacterium]|nr:protoporphyrinogen oxidase [Lacipirellulaceae bacterium]
MASPDTTPSAAPRVAIVGGGVSALAAARRLIELLPHAAIDLFEASDRLGGILNTVQRGGFLIEQSADNFLIKPPAALDLCGKVGLQGDLLTTDESRRRAFVVRSGKLVPIPEGFYLMSPRRLWPILTSPALSLRGKLRLLLEPFIPRRKSGFADDAPDQNSDESVAAFARRRLGREVFEQLVQPLVAGIYTADPEQLSMAATMPQFREYERSSGSLLRATLRFRRPVDANDGASAGDHTGRAASGARYGLFVTPKDGMSSLVGNISSQLSQVNIHLNAPIAGVHVEANRWRLQINASQLDNDSQSNLYDAAILALPAPAAAKVLKTSIVDLANELSAIDYAGCAVISLGFRRTQISHPLDGFGFVVPENERRRIIAGSFASLKFPGRAPEHHVLIRVFIGGALQPEMQRLPDDELIRIATEELTELLQITGSPVVTDVARWPNSMPQYHVGHLARVRRIEQIVTQHPTLALAGNAYRGVGIPHCVLSGESAASRIADSLFSSRK